MAAEKKKTVKPAAERPASGPMGQIFGVRHLSPAGAWHLQKFLATVDPTAILIEGPSDATDLLQHLVHKKTKPPVALLAFTKARPVRSILYPLAAYSPEWIALTAGLKAKKLVRFMDLPAETFLAMHEEPPPREPEAVIPGGENKELTPEDEEAREKKLAASSETMAYMDDPYEAIARLSGDPDHDTWWEKHFEHATEENAYQHAIHEFGRGLREIRRDTPAHEKETLTREAYMRRVIAQTINEGHDPARVVVVCGAFHSTALDWSIPAMTDAEEKKLPRVETSLTLMPYSYYRLSSQSGYGAGNHAPGYFQKVWEESSGGNFRRLPTRYMAELAARMRLGGQTRSSAEVIEAVRLAHAVASLGDGSAPTLRDLRDAAVTCLGGGDRAVVERFCRDVEVGDAIGELPPGVSRTSIQDDFYHLVKSLRLEEYLKDKAQMVKGQTGDAWLDLRPNRFVKSADASMRDRNRSVFFHRLVVLGIAFAKPKDTHDTERGDREFWELQWSPKMEIDLVENALRGDTIEIAAVRTLQERLRDADNVREAARLARLAYRCDLPDVMDMAVRRVQGLAIDDASFKSIASGARSLGELAMYPNKLISSVDVKPVEPLVAQLFLRGALLAFAAAHCDDDEARGVVPSHTPEDDDDPSARTKIGVGPGLDDLDWLASRWPDTAAPLAFERWTAALQNIAEDDGCNAFVSGIACAILLERGHITDDALENRVAQRLSPGMDPGAGAGFFEGLVSRNRAALLGKRKLWTALTEFVQSLEDPAFRRAVVGLRRAFAPFELGEVRRISSILAEVWGGGAAEMARAVETKVDEKELASLNDELGDLGDLDL